MKALILYESSYGNTHTVAEAIAKGLAPHADVRVVAVNEFDDADATVDLLVVGGPTHVHGLSRQSTRKAAVDAAAKPDSRLVLDAAATGRGLRAWLAELEARRAPLPRYAAVFDTRADAPVMVTGRASRTLARRLRRLGCNMLDKPRSFLVDKENRLEPSEKVQATEWGRHLAAKTAAVLAGPTA